jgi:esterase/lipase superfamily enzyme
MREIQKWFSPNLNKDMEIVVYGYSGYALLLFPTAAADYLEYERFYMIDAIGEYLGKGDIKVFSINSINSESWLNSDMHPADRATRHQQFNKYIVDEVVPFIKTHCKGKVPIVTAGASLGAFHSANIFFRRPDLFAGVIAMSGSYDVKVYSDGYYDDNCYFNSPVDYLPNLTDKKILSTFKNKQIIISSGQGDYEAPEESQRLSEILTSKGINHWLDIWGYDIVHDWPTWRQMLPYYLSKIKF